MLPVKTKRQMKTTRFSKKFELILGQIRQTQKDDVMQSLRVSQGLEGLTDSWTCRFDDSKLHQRTGLTTGKTLHFLTVCQN